MSRPNARPGALHVGLRLGLSAALLLLGLGIVPVAAAATTSAFPSSNAAISGSWTSPENAYADDGAHATVSISKNSTVARAYGNFGFDAVIPAGATISSVTVELQYRVSVTNGDDQVRAQPYVGATATGNPATGGPVGSDTTISATTTGVFTRSNLLDGTFTVHVSDQRTTPGAPSHTFLVDFVRVTVTYNADTTAPVVTVPADITAEATGPAGATVTFSASATDDIDGPLTPTCTPASGSTFPLGATTVTCTATDAAGNTGSASFTVTVVDTTPPVVTVPADVTIEATSPSGATVTYATSATDLVSGSLTPVCTNSSGSTFPLGKTTVTCTATDAAGNTGSASFTVTVVDTTPPDLVVPADRTVEATGPTGATVTFSASATDLVDGDVTPVCAPASGSTFPIGTTTVTCTATDAAGNGSIATFDVTVVDTTPPTITTPDGKTPPDLTVPATGPNGAVVSFVLGATDGVDGELTPSCSPASGSTFPVGTTTVTCTVTDRAGNVGQVEFAVTVTPFEGPTPTTPPTSTGTSGIAASPAGSGVLVLWLVGMIGALGLLAVGIRRRA